MTTMVEGLTQNQVKDLIYVGAFYYEALLRDKNLINDRNNTVNGVIPFPTWENHMLANFSQLDLDLNLFRRYLPNAYIRSKATLLGALSLARGKREFEPWRVAVLSDLTDEERTKVNPYLAEVFETSQKLAAEARPGTQKDMSPPRFPFTTNRNQRIALLTGTIIFILMLLLPPWHFGSGRSYGYRFLFWPPARRIFIDSTRLIVQCVLVAALTLGAFVLLRSKRN